MYVQQISIPFPKKPDEEFFRTVDLLMNFYRGSGQSLGRIHIEYLEKNSIVALHHAHERNSFSSKYNSFYVNRELERLKNNYAITPVFSVAGKASPGKNYVCKCVSRDFMILTTNYISIGSPVICGSCTNSVPLYKLPVYDDYGYMPILSWESNYQSCDRLQMNCEVGERFGLNQLELIDSQLSKQGREICARLEVLTETPVYYYLHNYTKRRGTPESILCPGCGKKWHLKNLLCEEYNFMCKHCRIVSIESPYSRS
ncbi:MAG: DUF2310 family Zn-ribbon-containing protein [Bacteroidota bacterium]|jgi:predicted  nucleic acid-binding Zn ribbon protein